MNGAEWLAWFVEQPQAWCPTCRRMNEVNPPSWWGANCWHSRRAALAAHDGDGSQEGRS